MTECGCLAGSSVLLAAAARQPHLAACNVKLTDVLAISHLIAFPGLGFWALRSSEQLQKPEKFELLFPLF